MAENQSPHRNQTVGSTVEPGGKRGVTRRELLLAGGATAGCLALAGTPLLIRLFESLAGTRQPLVGVVAPASDRFPHLLAQLAAGVTQGLAKAGQVEAKVVARRAKHRTPSAAAAAAEELVKKAGASLVLVYANPTRVTALGDLAEKSGVPIVVVDPGAHIVATGDSDPRVLAHSLGYWQSAWLLGFSTSKPGSKIYSVSSIYESGFDVARAFWHGAQKAGGSIVGYGLTGVNKGDVADAIANAAKSGADSLFVAASGSEAAEILRAVGSNAGAARMKLLVPGLGVEQMASVPRLRATTALSWPVGGQSAFRSLGQDVGALVAAAVAGGVEALPAGAHSFTGVRGGMRVDLVKGRTDVPVRVSSVTSSDGKLVLGEQKTPQDSSKATAFANDIVASPRTGWLDVYGSAT